MSLDAITRFARNALEQVVQVTAVELDNLITPAADQVMAVRRLCQSIAMAAVVHVNPAQHAGLHQNVQRAIHRDQAKPRITLVRSLVNLRRRERLMHRGDHVEHRAARGRQLVSMRVDRLADLFSLETHVSATENGFQLEF